MNSWLLHMAAANCPHSLMHCGAGMWWRKSAKRAVASSQLELEETVECLYFACRERLGKVQRYFLRLQFRRGIFSQAAIMKWII